MTVDIQKETNLILLFLKLSKLFVFLEDYRMALKRLRDLAFQDDSSDDEDFVARRPRWIREREDYFNNLDDIDFQQRFRLSKTAVLEVLNAIMAQLQFPSNKNDSVSPMNQLLCTLRYYATGCHQMTVGDFSGVSKSTAHRIIHCVSAAIASLRPLHIVFPERAEDITKTYTEFFRIASFPRVIGAIDCTHVKIKNPGGDNAEWFRCRKGFFSLNIQAICNARLEFIDIVARWPGSTHDSVIFQNCYRKSLFDSGTYGNSLLVGDSGYRCNKYMMTPFENPSTSAEHLFNESQIRTRNTIERMFGVWKRRFPVLALGLHVNLENSLPIVVATAVLHNILRRRNEPVPSFEPNFERQLPAPWDIIMAQGDMGGSTIHQNLNINQGRRNPDHRERQAIVEQYYTRLVQMEIQRREATRDN